MGLIITPVSDASLITTDITTNDATTSKHGLRAKLTNAAGSFQDEQGTVKSTVVQTDQANTFSTGAQSLASATSLLVPTSAGYAPTANGSLGFDSTQNAWSAGGAGTINGKLWRLLYVTTPAADTLTAATINTTETQFASTFQIPANYLIANKLLRVTYLIQDLSTATIPTRVYKIRLGAVGIGGTIVAQGSAYSAVATTFGHGLTYIIVGTAAAGASVNVVTIPITPVTLTDKNVTSQPVAIATNAAQNINFTLTYSGNGASNTTQVLAMIVEEGN